jgi:vesicle coat complex subunit
MNDRILHVLTLCTLLRKILCLEQRKRLQMYNLEGSSMKTHTDPVLLNIELLWVLAVRVLQSINMARKIDANRRAAALRNSPCQRSNPRTMFRV